MVEDLPEVFMPLKKLVRTATRSADALIDAGRTGNVKLLMSLVGPAMRDLVANKALHTETINLKTGTKTQLSWDYTQSRPELARLYSAGKKDQWDAETALDWSINVDPDDDQKYLLPERILPLRDIPSYRKLPKAQKNKQRHDIMAWLLSQFLHGEQGALLASCQITNAVGDMGSKLFGATQVVDEARHVEVFHRYLHEKLDKVYPVNDNLYIILDALLSDSRWDIKFLGMQILVEGLALGSFGTIRAQTKEPLLRKLLRYVIKDEARHVHYGVLSLGDLYNEELSETARREREDWAFEMSRLMRNRFLAHQFYEEYYAHIMSQAEWNKTLMNSDFMAFFRWSMFRRVMPNLARINLLTDRISKHYKELNLLTYKAGKAAPELTLADLIAKESPPWSKKKRTQRKTA